MKHIKTFGIFESANEPELIDVQSIDEFKKSFSEEFQTPGKVWEETDKFRIWDEFFNDGTFDESKYLILNGEIIGGILIFQSDISAWYVMKSESDTTTDLKVHDNPESFRDKSGVYLEYIFVKPEWRNMGFGKKMISHIESLGYDYMWEMSVEKKAARYWIDNIKRDILFEYENSEEPFGRTFVTYKIL